LTAARRSRSDCAPPRRQQFSRPDVDQACNRVNYNRWSRREFCSRNERETPQRRSQASLRFPCEPCDRTADIPNFWTQSWHRVGALASIQPERPQSSLRFFLSTPRALRFLRLISELRANRAALLQRGLSLEFPLQSCRCFERA